MLTLAQFWARSIRQEPSAKAQLLWMYADLPIVPKQKRHRRRQPTVPNWGLTCWACGSSTPTDWHHIIPVSAGGTNILRNFVKLCGDCHLQIHIGHERSTLTVSKKTLKQQMVVVDSDEIADRNYEINPDERRSRALRENRINREEFEIFRCELRDKFESGEGEEYTPEDARDLWEANFG